MLATGRKYVIDREDEADNLEIEAVNSEVKAQIDENTRRILEKFLNGGAEQIESVSRSRVDEYDGDTMPSTTTLDYASSKAVEKTKVKETLSLKSKILIAVYISVVLALVLSIALTSMSLNESSSAVSEMKAYRDSVLSEIGTLELTINEIENGYDVAAAAAQLGYIIPSEINTSYYSSPQTRAPQQYTVNNNWFDTICDFLSGIFG